MSTAQQQWIVLWAALLSAVVCLGFLPVSRLISVCILLGVLGLIMVLWYTTRRPMGHDVTPHLNNLPEAHYRQPVVLVCGDLPLDRAQQSVVLTAPQGCWIRVEDNQDLVLTARQILSLRPDWGRQLSVMVCVCPQWHVDSKRLTSRLLALRWKISQLRKASGYSVPLVLCGQAGSAMIKAPLWQAALPGEGIRVWREATAPCSIAAWVTSGGAQAMQQQVLMNSLSGWFQLHVSAAFTDENPDIPVITPAALVWGMGPELAGSLASSSWMVWLSRHTAIQQVKGWHPAGTNSTACLPLADFILPLLPEGPGVTSRIRAWRRALGIFTLAVIAALLSSGWNNRQLLHRVGFDLAHYAHIPMDNYVLKADAVAALQEDAAQLDNWARHGVPARMSLGLYQGERLRVPVLHAIRSYDPPPESSKPLPALKPVATTVQLESLSLFDSGQSDLKPDSTSLLAHSLVDIKARPGWLIVVAGHTDNTGNPERNQQLSLKRADAVRNWMRDSGEVPESCFAVQGYGASRPVASNNTPEGRELNRRVEISLVPQADACRPPGNPQALSPDDDAILCKMEK